MPKNKFNQLRQVSAVQNDPFGHKNRFFLRYALKTHFFGFRQTRLNGIISSSYPEVTLDTFGFPVGACLAARRAVFWPRLPKNGPFWAENAIFSTLCPYNPLFWPQTDPAQWDHILPISPGNFGCLWFSGRCLFGRSAGCFLAPIAQNGRFWGENAIFSMPFLSPLGALI